jgi:hypothetical protein
MSVDITEDVLGFKVGERDRGVQYHLPEIRRGLEDGSTTINLAGLNAWGDMNAISKEKVEADLNEVKRLLVHLVKENTVLRDSLTKENKALRHNLTNENKSLRESIMSIEKTLKIVLKVLR